MILKRRKASSVALFGSAGPTPLRCVFRVWRPQPRCQFYKASAVSGQLRHLTFILEKLRADCRREDRLLYRVTQLPVLDPEREVDLLDNRTGFLKKFDRLLHRQSNVAIETGPALIHTKCQLP